MLAKMLYKSVPNKYSRKLLVLASSLRYCSACLMKIMMSRMAKEMEPFCLLKCTEGADTSVGMERKKERR